MEKLLSTLRGFGAGRLIAMAGIGIGVIAAIIALSMNLGSQPKALLYSNLDLKEASQVTEALTQAGVKYEVKGDGSTIMVDRDKVASTRLLVSGKGLVTTGSIGYEIFDSGNALGQTDFVQQLNRQRALEGELARTIKALDGVTFANVRLVIPKRQLFEDQAEQPSASITIGVGGRAPSTDQVQAVQNLVAGAVPNLKPERVTVIDQRGKTLSAGSDGSLAGKLADDRKTEVEQRIADRVKAMVEGVVGPGKARVEVTADLDMARVTQQKETYDPDGQVIRSEQTSEEKSEEGQQDGSQAVTASANIPGGAAQPPGFLPLNKNTTGSNQSTTNYEISKTVRTEVLEPGTVRKLSVAVAVDGATGAPVKGKAGAYTPRTEAEMQQLDQLVKAAVGFDQGRGDMVKVTNVRFAREAELEAGTMSGGLFSFTKDDIMRAIEIGVLGVVAILLILFGLRPIIKSLNRPAGTALALTSGAGVATRMVTMPDGATQAIAVDAATGEPLALPGPDIEQRIEIAKIEGQVKASSIKRVSEFVGRHPDDSVAILRSWLHETP